ncbi:hypothetical protein [Syntrophotalea carbinolica]|uniref:hypothetical protein n=1 Tax=Syntrophotalea carbinolica TaxID=19 RepID=UPI0011D15A61|nr:hypothetical protein [Syntrophotalea carbinolica]
MNLTAGGFELNDTADSTNKTNRCPRCGGPLWYQRVGTDDGIAPGLSCVLCGFWRDVDDAPRGMTRQVVKNRNTRVPCSVVGCQNMIHLENNETGRCTKCNRLMFDWERSAKTKPAPIIKVLDRWIFNPDRKNNGGKN